MDCLRSKIEGVAALLILLTAAPGFCADPPHAERAQAEAAQAEPGAAGKAAAGEESPSNLPLARYLTLTSPVDDVVFGRVQNAALTLQSQARSQHRRAILVLEITPGSSPFHQVYGLATFLTSSDISDIKTVAWLPETVTGNNVILALACNEILMRPDAELGDIGRGKPLDRDEQHDVVRLVEKRHNPRVSPALVMGMMDSDKATLRVKLQIPSAGKETTEFRIVSKDELERLRQTKITIVDVQTIKEAGDTGMYSGTKARNLGVLAVQTVDSRGEIAQLYNLPREALRDEPASGDKPRAQMIKIDGKIEPVLEAFIERQIDRAVADGVNTIIFHIDSTGGPLQQSQNLASSIADLDPKKVRTIAYIPKEAIGSAAVIAMGCDEIYMQPTAHFGDARPMQGDSDRENERIADDIVRHFKESLSTLAKQKGRPEGIAEAMADKSVQVFQVKNRRTGRVWFLTDAEIHNSNGEWEKGLPVPESGRNQLLTLNGARAHELLLAEPPVRDFDDLKQRLGVPPETNIAEATRTWVDSLVFWLNTDLALFFLVVVGFICIYVELHLMTGVLSIIAALCFALFFWSHFLGGTAGWLEVVLFLIGAGCLALEIFVLPGVGIFGVTGVLLIFSSLILASQTWHNIEPNEDYKRLSWTLGTLGGSIISVIIIAVTMSRFLPHVRVFDRLVLSPPGVGDLRHLGPRLRPGLADDHMGGSLSEQLRVLVGHEGIAITGLRPAGKAKINGRLIDVVSDGPFIPQDRRIEVVEVSGNRIVVRAIG
jgi:membrane-bound serine protease (ClpP class)